MAQPLSVAFGIRQAKLDDDARAFFRDARPWAFILFREACISRAQVKALCAELRGAVSRDALVWIDQEGGTSRAPQSARMAHMARVRALWRGACKEFQSGGRGRVSRAPLDCA
jgi:beta-N-acetylhexosaminidase